MFGIFNDQKHKCEAGGPISSIWIQISGKKNQIAYKKDIEKILSKFKHKNIITYIKTSKPFKIRDKITKASPLSFQKLRENHSKIQNFT